MDNKYGLGSDKVSAEIHDRHHKSAGNRIDQHGADDNAVRMLADLGGIETLQRGHAGDQAGLDVLHAAGVGKVPWQLHPGPLHHPIHQCH